MLKTNSHRRMLNPVAAESSCKIESGYLKTLPYDGVLIERVEIIESLPPSCHTETARSDYFYLGTAFTEDSQMQVFCEPDAPT